MSQAALEFQQAMDFIDRVEATASLDELSDELANTLENFSVSSFTMAAMVAEHEGELRVPKLLIRRNDDGWQFNYRDKKLYNIDPTVHTALKSPYAFTWADVENGRLSKEVRDMFAETREAMHVEGGLMIPTHDEDGCAGMIMLYHDDRELPPKVRQALKLISIYAIERAKELHALHELKGKIVCPLTLRQREILSYVAEGKSDWDIGQILSISQNTVNEHIEKAKDSMGVKTRAQAVAVAVKRRWIKL